MATNSTIHVKLSNRIIEKWVIHCTDNVKSKAAEEYYLLFPPSITSAEESTFEKFGIDLGLSFRKFGIKDLQALGKPEYDCVKRPSGWLESN